MRGVLIKNAVAASIADLSLRTQTALEWGGIHTLDHLRQLSDQELLRLPGFGRKSLREIRAMIGPWPEPAAAAPTPAPEPKPAPQPEPVVTMALETFVQTFIAPKFERLHYALDALAIEIRGERAAFFAGVEKITAAGAAVRKKRKKSPKDTDAAQ
jgi:hypothetical protein